MLKLYIYGYLNRIRSSRSLEKECARNIELMWLMRKLRPDFKTIADFRKDNRRAIKQVCGEFTLLCKKLELFGGELVAIDSSKFRASNSKKRNFNEAKLKRATREIEEKVREYLAELDDNDKREAGVKSPGAEELKAKIEILRDRRGKYQGLLKELRASGESQISLTDPDSRAMLNNQRVEVCYNVQATVDDKHKIILDHEVTNEAKDQDQLSRMGKRAKEILGVEGLEVLADKGYYKAVEVKECVDNGIIPYIPGRESRVPKEINVPRPEFYKDRFKYDGERDLYLCPSGRELTFKNRARHHGKMMRLYQSKQCQGCQLRPQCTRNKKGRIIYRWEHEEVLEDMRQRVESNRDKVKMRQWLSEHPFGTIKRSMNQGYLLLRGLDKVAAEVSLTVLAYNIKRVINIVGLKAMIEALA